ncbi:MAG: hypothetical protein K2K86_05970, partial [Muribaculaceae bacterium]|nr:hypothetical protein [Muribaculaceae bacterium]
EGLDAAEVTDSIVDSVYVADRYTKASEILDLMDEKLPVRFAPYSIQEGQQIGTLYVELGNRLGRPELADHGRSIIRDEILRYGRYIPYYRSLIEREGGIIAGSQSTKTVNSLNLSRIDRYIPVYVTNLLQSYIDAGGDVDEVDATLVEMGVNLDDIIPITGYGRQSKQ